MLGNDKPIILVKNDKVIKNWQNLKALKDYFVNMWNDKLRVAICELRVVSCYLKSYFLRVAVLKE